MHISEPTPVRRRISLTPLVDVIFLLLMFFMLSSTFARFADLDVARQSATPGESGFASSEPAPLRGAIVSVSADLQVRVNGTATAPDDIAATLDALYDRGARTAIVVADYRATVQDLVSVLERARQSKIAVAIAQ
ncbi:MAG TPA: biopolymer transporter ExbD [Aestuariivirgaceae bacterium]|nr:biopolymer transporter ExbD [Aestuariivirgaceae bacterium]